jgi:hypothetical protein
MKHAERAPSLPAIHRVALGQIAKTMADEPGHVGRRLLWPEIDNLVSRMATVPRHPLARDIVTLHQSV